MIKEIVFIDPDFGMLNAKVVDDHIEIDLEEFLAWFAKLQREILG